MFTKKQHHVVKLVGLLFVVVMLLFAGCGISKKSTKSTNNPPGAPSVPVGSATWVTGTSYTCSTQAVDPDGDQVSIKFDWGDSTQSVWSDFVASGETVSMSHSYSDSGTFQIRAKAKDEKGVESEWSGTHTITIGGGEQEGTIKWQLNLGRWDSPTHDPAMGPDGTIYVTVTTSTGLAKLYAVTPDGTKKWECELSTWCADNPVVGSDGTIYVISCAYVDAVSPNGTLQWEWVADPVADINGLTLGDDGTIYVGHHGSGAYYRKVFAINPDGTQKWSIELSGSSHTGLTIGQNGEVYVSDANGESNYPLYAVDPDNGLALWSVELGNWVGIGGMVVGSGGSIYVPLPAGAGGKLVTISPNHTISWEYTLPASPGIPSIGPDGTIYVIAASGYVDGDLYALTSNGTLKWNAGNAPRGT